MKPLRTACSLALIVLLASLLSSCAGKKRVAVAKPARIGSSSTGIASWYGEPYHGRRAANGEIYNMEAMTAAHRTLPFGTWVRVKNLTNERTVDVRIQDRGPFVGRRVIDLSRAAAREIEMIGPGTAKVKLTVIAAKEVRTATTTSVTPSPSALAPIPPPPTFITEPELFAVQAGAFQDRGKAEALSANMRALYGTSRVVFRDGKPPVYRVLVGEEDSMEKANALSERIRAAGTEGFVVRLDAPPASN